MKLIPLLPAFQDNSLWLLHDGHRSIAADPGDVQPVIAALRHHGMQLGPILVTHHDARTTTDKVGVFAAVQQWMNKFR